MKKNAPTVGISPERIDNVVDLVDGATVPGRPRGPLFAIHGTELPVRRGPFIPNGHAVLIKPGDIRITTQEPNQLVRDAFEMQSLGRQQRKTVRQVVTKLPAEH